MNPGRLVPGRTPLPGVLGQHTLYKRRRRRRTGGGGGGGEESQELGKGKYDPSTIYKFSKN